MNADVEIVAVRRHREDVRRSAPRRVPLVARRCVTERRHLVETGPEQTPEARPVAADPNRAGVDAQADPAVVALQAGQPLGRAGGDAVEVPPAGEDPHNLAGGVNGGDRLASQQHRTVLTGRDVQATRRCDHQRARGVRVVTHNVTVRPRANLKSTPHHRRRRRTADESCRAEASAMADATSKRGCPPGSPATGRRQR